MLFEHGLAVLQDGWGELAVMTVVDYQSLRPASKKRVSAWEREYTETHCDECDADLRVSICGH